MSDESRDKKEHLSKCVGKESMEIILKSNTNCTTDLAAVMMLPDQWFPQRSGPTLMNYLKESEENYKLTLCSMLKEINIVNNDVDEKVHDMEDKLYTFIKGNHVTMECVLNDFLEAEKSPRRRDLALEEIKKIYDQSVRDMEKFKKNVVDLETLRSENIKSIIQTKFDKLVSIEQYNPNIMLHNFDEHVCRINNQLSTNLKAYFKFVCQLKSHLEEIINYTRSMLNEHCLNRRTITFNAVNICNSEEELDIKKIVVCLVDASQGAISKLCVILFNYLEDLQKNMYNSILFDEEQVLLDLDKHIMDGLQGIFNCCSQYVTLEREDQTHKIIDYMSDSFCSFGENICSTYRVLYDTCFILNTLFLRLAEARRLTLANVESLQIKNDADVLINEYEFNIVLEQMLAAPDEDKVNYQFDILKSLLQKQDHLYYKHSVNEVNTLKEYTNLMFHIIDIFYSECVGDLKANSKALQNKTSTFELDSVLLSYLKTQGFLPRAILQDQKKYSSLSSWKKKFLASFEAKIPIISSLLYEKCKKWIEEKCLILNMRYSLKCMSLIGRIERVQAARNGRVTEIHMHESRLKSHLDTIYKFIKTIPIEASTFIDFDSKELYPLNYWVTQIENNMNLLIGPSNNNMEKLEIDPEFKKLKLKSYVLRLSKYSRQFEKSVESAVTVYKKGVDTRLKSARFANLQFMEEIKLFSEGGKYSVAEAVRTRTKLADAAKAIETCTNVTLNAVKSCQKRLLSLAVKMVSSTLKNLNKSKHNI